MVNKGMIETSIAFLEIQDDILYIRIKDNAHVTLESSVENVAARRELQQGKKMLILLDSSKVWQVSDKARNYAAEPEVTELSIATAIVTGNVFAPKMITNFYIKFNKPSTPTETFKSVDEALVWLATFKSELV